MLDGNHYVECGCFADEHLLRFTLDAEAEEIYTSVFLNHWQPWYKRAWHAIKYVFGYKCKYGHFDCTVIDSRNVGQLKELIAKFDELIAAKQQ